MRLRLSVIIIFAIVTFGAPLAVFITGDDVDPIPETGSSSQPNADKISDNKGELDGATIKIYDEATQQVSEILLYDYLIGAVAAEVPPTFDPEAIKAQALACSTYAVRLRQLAKETPDDAIGGADVSVNSRVHQGYISNDDLQEKWGQNYDYYYGVIKEAVDAVKDKVIVYEDAPIISAFHSISPGQTEAAEDVWGQGVSYLVSVDSPGDLLASDYTTKETFTSDVLKESLLGKNADIQFSDNPAEWFQNADATESGTVKTIEVCGTTLTGSDIRTALNLRCAAFTIAYSEGVFTFTVKGYGHGVGMSQYGADYMGRQGSTAEEIIAHYYPGTSLGNIKDFL